MSNYYSDPTANMALGSVERELKQMKKRARQLRRYYRLGLLTPEEISRARRQFTGIYRRFLEEALG